MSLTLEMATAEDAIRSHDTSLVDIVDGLLRHGVVIRGEIWLTVADVDLVFLGLDLLLASPDKMRPAGLTQ
ncbi:gas vesicle protein GvpJ [Yoonia sp.]|uniref:gas vesicle protein GvpJ n=1 Tax=Yoonia sp. TaxID=2212373 RepID=UPI00358EF02D